MLRWSLALITVLAGAALLGTVAAAGGGCHSQDPSTSQARGTAVDIRQCKFTPVVLFAPVGATVSWAQNDVVPHNVVGLGWGDGSSFMYNGTSVQSTFANKGIYPYHCTLHPEMSGVVIVGDVDLSGASAPAGSLAAAAPARTVEPTVEPTSLVASASAPARSGPDAPTLAYGLLALGITGLAGFAAGRRLTR